MYIADRVHKPTLLSSIIILCSLCAAGSVSATPTKAQKLVAGDASGSDFLGWSADIDGDTAIVGAWANNDGGSAYIFVRNSSGVWQQSAKLVPADLMERDRFGWSVAIDNNTAIVGSVNGDSFDRQDAGAAYIFVQEGNSWLEQQKLTASDAEPGDNFAYAVDIEGNTAIVGARLVDTDGGSDSGAGYIFTRAADNVWTEESVIVASDPGPDVRFGTAVALSGGMAVIGAPGESSAGQFTGAAYIFSRSSGIWAEQHKLLASDPSANDLFGLSVDIAGNTALIGAFGNSDAGSASGAAYAFSNVGNLWIETKKLSASDAAANDWFGFSVAIDEDTAVIGSPFGSGGTEVDSGASYLFTRNVNGWTEKEIFVPSDGVFGQRFGWSVVIDSGTGLVGAFADSNFRGAAYVFDLCDDMALVKAKANGKLDDSPKDVIVGARVEQKMQQGETTVDGWLSYFDRNSGLRIEGEIDSVGLCGKGLVRALGTCGAECSFTLELHDDGRESNRFVLKAEDSDGLLVDVNDMISEGEISIKRR